MNDLQARKLVHIARGGEAPRIVAPHYHERHTLAVATSGTHRMRCRGSSHVVGPAQVVCFNQGEIHEATPDGESGWGYRMVFLDDTLIAAAARGLGVPASVTPRFRRSVVTNPLLAELVTAVCEARAASDDLALDVMLTALIRCTIRHHMAEPGISCRASTEHWAAKVAQEYLREHYARSVTLADLAHLVGLNGNYLVQVFTQHVGVAPHQYLNQVRVARAQELIARGTPVSTAAATVGYCDQSHLTRHFKRALGITPGAYRRLNYVRAAAS